MSNINELSVSSRTIQSKIIESNGNMTFRLQDKEATENGNVTADVGYDALSKVNVNVQGGGSSSATAYVWYGDGLYSGGILLYLDTDIAPRDDELLNVKKIYFNSDNGILSVEYFVSGDEYDYYRINDTEFKLNGSSYMRGNSDFTLWEVTTNGDLED